jgi:hypothetical protein
LFRYSQEADFIQRLLKKNEKKLARFFNFTFRCIDDVLSLSNSMLGDFVDCSMLKISVSENSLVHVVLD